MKVAFGATEGRKARYEELRTQTPEEIHEEIKLATAAEAKKREELEIAEAKKREELEIAEAKEKQEEEAAWKQVQLGISRERVVELLGPPNSVFSLSTGDVLRWGRDTVEFTKSGLVETYKREGLVY